MGKKERKTGINHSRETKRGRSKAARVGNHSNKSK